MYSLSLLFCFLTPNRKSGEFHVFPAEGPGDGVTHRRAPPAGGAICQALPQSRID